jgi:hypothetical protein
MEPEQDQTEALSLRAAYPFAAEHGLQREGEEIRTMPIDWTLKIKSAVRRGHIVDLFERSGLLEAFKDRHWACGRTPGGERKRRWYLGLKARYDDFLSGRGADDTIEPGSEPEDSEQQFAVESDLRDFLANNLSIIESDLKLYRDGDRTGVEYSIDDGRIDILAVDRDNRPVVIELKVSRGRNRTIGQLLYYMGCVDEHLRKGRSRGVIVAREISDDLVVATQRVPEVSLFRYRLSVSIEPVTRTPRNPAEV